MVLPTLMAEAQGQVEDDALTVVRLNKNISQRGSKQVQPVEEKSSPTDQTQPEHPANVELTLADDSFPPLSGKEKEAIRSSSCSDHGPSVCQLACCYKKLVEEFTCAICLEICYEPCTLICGHTFCKMCLECCYYSWGTSCPHCEKTSMNTGFPVLSINIMAWNAIQVLFPHEIAEHRRRITSAQKEEHPVTKNNHGNGDSSRSSVNSETREVSRPAVVASQPAIFLTLPYQHGLTLSNPSFPFELPNLNQAANFMNNGFQVMNLSNRFLTNANNGFQESNNNIVALSQQPPMAVAPLISSGFVLPREYPQNNALNNNYNHPLSNGIFLGQNSQHSHYRNPQAGNQSIAPHGGGNGTGLLRQNHQFHHNYTEAESTFLDGFSHLIHQSNNPPAGGSSHIELFRQNIQSNNPHGGGRNPIEIFMQNNRFSNPLGAGSRTPMNLFRQNNQPLDGSQPQHNPRWF